MTGASKQRTQTVQRSCGWSHTLLVIAMCGTLSIQHWAFVSPQGGFVLCGELNWAWDRKPLLVTVHTHGLSRRGQWPNCNTPVAATLLVSQCCFVWLFLLSEEISSQSLPGDLKLWEDVTGCVLTSNRAFEKNYIYSLLSQVFKIHIDHVFQHVNKAACFLSFLFQGYIYTHNRAKPLQRSILGSILWHTV